MHIFLPVQACPVSLAAQLVCTTNTLALLKWVFVIKVVFTLAKVA
jgi:hypothetical protein